MARKTKTSADHTDVMVGDIVVWYENNKVKWDSGRPVVVEKLYLPTKEQIVCAAIMGPYRTIENVWHVSHRDNPELKGSHWWATKEEHQALYDEERERREIRKSQQEEEAERRAEFEERRHNAVRAVRRGDDLNEVADAAGMAPAELRELAEIGV